MSYSTAYFHAGYQSGCEFPDHDATGVGIGRRNRGHDRGIGDAQAVNAAHAQLGVHHRLPVQAHRAGPHRVEIAQARLTSELRGVFPAHSLRWDYPALDQVEVCRLRREVEAQFDAGRQGIDVGLFRQKVRLDLERAIGLRASDPEIASAEGPHETREEGEGVRWDHVPGGDLVRDQRHLRGQNHQIGPGKCGRLFQKHAVPPRLLFGAGRGCFASKHRPRIQTWSWRFRPTPGRSTRVSMPRCLRSACGPMPDSNRRRGEWIAPTQRISSLDVPTERSLPSSRKSRPVHRVPVNLSLSASASVRTVRFWCAITGHRYASAGLQRMPSRMFRFMGPTPSGSGKFMSSRYGIPYDRPAAMNAAVTECSFLARSTRIGPPAPRTSLSPSSQSSACLKSGNTEWKSQPVLPASAQPS